jgi:hypothetical protein
MGFSYSAKLFGGVGSGSSLPSLTGNTGKVLTVNATENGTEWAAGPAPAAAGADTQVLFNDGGAIAGNAGFTFTKASAAVGITGPLTLTPTADIVPATFRAYSSGTNYIQQNQTSANAVLSGWTHAGEPFLLAGKGAGKVLTSDANGVGTWAATVALANGGTGADLSAVAKGGIVTGTGAGTVGVTTVGVDGTFLKANSAAAGGVEWAAGGGGGITNGAGANVIPKSDGTNLVASALSEASAGSFATSAGTALSLAATAPAATTGPAQNGKSVTIMASNGVASTNTAGAADGGEVLIQAGAPARLTSGYTTTYSGAVRLKTATTKVVADDLWAPVILESGASKLYFRQHATAGTDVWQVGTPGGVLIVGDLGFPSLVIDTDSGFKAVTGAADTRIGWSSTGDGLVASTQDTLVRRKAAANPAWGAASATPVAYTHSLAADGSGTNIAGASATLLPGVGTGTGAASRLLLGGPLVGSTGSAAQSTATPVSIGGEVKADGTESFVNVTGTLPASPSAAVSGVKLAVTSVASIQDQSGLAVTLAAGANSTGTYAAVRGTNNTSGQGNTAHGGSTIGVLGEATAAGGTQNRCGVTGYASGGANNVGIQGTAYGANAVGVRGTCYQPSTTNGAAGMFSLAWGDTFPTGIVALLADNSSYAVPIFQARDNGTQVFSINDGGGVNLYREVTAVTTTATPDGTNSNIVYTNEGDADGATVTLPTAVKGLTFTFYVQTAQTLTVTANTGDTIRVSSNVTAAAGSITSNVVGSSLTLVAINSVEWVAVSALGTWVV